MSDSPQGSEPLSDEEAAKIRADAAKEEFGEEDSSKGAGEMPPPEDDLSDLQETDETEEAGDDDPGTEEDLYADVSPALRAHIEGLETKVSNYSNTEERLKQTENRVGSLQNLLQNQQLQKDRDAKKAQDAKDAEPTAEEIAAAAASDEAWKELVQEFPEWGKAIDGKISTETAARTTLEKKVANMEKVLDEPGPSTEKVEVLEKEINELRVSIKHPGWEETISSDDWKTWKATQPQDVIDKISSYDAADAIHVLNLFAGREKKPGKPNTKRARLAAAETPPSSTTSRIPVKRVEDMTDDEYRKQAAEEEWAADT